MCQCTPNLKTPFCGKGDCQWPAKDQDDRSQLEIKRDEEVRDNALTAHYEKEYPQITLTSDMLKLILYDADLPKEKVEEIMTRVAKCQK